MKTVKGKISGLVIFAGVLLSLGLIYFLVKGPPRKTPSDQTIPRFTLVFTTGLRGGLLEPTELQEIDGVMPAEFVKVFMNLSLLRAQGENRREPVIFVDLGNALSGDEDISTLMKGVPMERLLSEIPLSALLASPEDLTLLKANGEGLGRRFTYQGNPENLPALKASFEVRTGSADIIFFALDDRLGPSVLEVKEEMKKFPDKVRIVLARTDKTEKLPAMLKDAHLIIPANFSPHLSSDRITVIDGIPMAPAVDSRFYAGVIRFSGAGPHRWDIQGGLEWMKPVDEVPPGAVLNIVIEAKNQFEILYRGRYRQVFETFAIWPEENITAGKAASVTAKAFLDFSGADTAICDSGIIKLPPDRCWGSRQILNLPGEKVILYAAEAKTEEIRKLQKQNKNLVTEPPLDAKNTESVTIAASRTIIRKYPDVFKNGKPLAEFPANFILQDYLRLHRGTLFAGKGGSADKLMNRGLLLYKKGQVGEAIKLWQTALKMEPKNPGIRRVLLSATRTGVSKKPQKPAVSGINPWPRFRGNIRGTGLSSAEGPDSPLLRWKYDTGSQISGSVAVSKSGAVYGGAEDRHLYALDSAGRLLWKFATGLPVRSTPAISADGTIIFGSDDRHLYALDKNGKLKWKVAGGFFFSSSPVIGIDGTIYAGCEDNSLYAVSPEGRIKWKLATEGPVFSSPAVAEDGTVYVGSQDHCIYAVNPDGSLKWKVKTGHQINSSPAVGSDGTIYIGCEDKNLYAVSPAGKVLWKGATGNYITSSPAVGSDGTIYAGSEDRHLYAFTKTGALLWKFETAGEVISSPLIDRKGRIYVGSDDGTLYAVNPDGSLLWKFQTRDPVMSSPAMDADGTIFFGSEDGNFYAVGR